MSVEVVHESGRTISVSPKQARAYVSQPGWRYAAAPAPIFTETTDSTGVDWQTEDRTTEPAAFGDVWPGDSLDES